MHEITAPDSSAAPTGLAKTIAPATFELSDARVTRPTTFPPLSEIRTVSDPEKVPVGHSPLTNETTALALVCTKQSV